MKAKKNLLILYITVLIVALFTMIVVSVNMSRVDDSDRGTGTSNISSDSAYVNKDAKLSDIKKQDGVVNVYIFWGNGCPHCKAEWEMLEELRKGHAGEFAVYGFEVWYNDDNRVLLDKFAAGVGNNDVEAVPFIIIGNEYYEGSQTEEGFLYAVNEARGSSFDVYFDKISK